jgi:hypothetical protein
MPTDDLDSNLHLHLQLDLDLDAALERLDDFHQLSKAKEVEYRGVGLRG